ncbi:MAG: glycosyltransferase family 2 protein [bacterium]
MILTIVVTVYNEVETILESIKQVQELDVEKQIIVVDNRSTDGTTDLLRDIKDPSIEIIYQPQNYGFGTSVAKGINLAKTKYVYIHYTDLEYDPSCVYQMIEMAERDDLDAVFGSRLFYRRNESKLKIIRERPFYLGTIITTFLTNALYHKKFTDVIGAKFYKASAFREINPQTLTGIGFDFEVVSKLCKYGYNVKEVPVLYTARTKGKKKVKAYHILPAVAAMLKVKFWG